MKKISKNKVNPPSTLPVLDSEVIVPRATLRRLATAVRKRYGIVGGATIAKQLDKLAGGK